jgi:ATP-dependent DNA ligase
MPSFDLVHSKQYDREVSLVSFDLELDSKVLRLRELLVRKAILDRLAKMRNGIESNLNGDGAAIFKMACRLGHEGNRRQAR